MVKTVALYTDAQGFGGAEVHLMSLAERLDRERFRPVVIYSQCRALLPFTERLRKLDIESETAPSDLRLRRPGDIIRLAGRLRVLGIDVFHAHKPYPLGCRFGMLAAILARCPVIVSTDQLRLPGVPPRRQRRLLRLLSVGMDAHIAVSTSVRQYLVDTLRLRVEKVRVIPNWIDPEQFSAVVDEAQVRFALEIPRGAIVVGCVARFHEQKGHEDLIAAAGTLIDRHPELVFLLVGDGETRPQIEARVHALALSSHFRLVGHRDDVPALLAAMDVVVLPSRYEGLPISVLEAMASATPVVATAVDGTVDAVENGETGILVPPGDVGALTEGLDLLIRNPEMRARMGSAARQRVLKHFTAGPLVRKTEALYEASVR